MLGSRTIMVVMVAALTGACSTSFTRTKIEGNNTGGIIPPAAAAGKNVQALADGHCAQYGSRARITFSGAEAGGDTVFICETAAGPALLGVPKSNTASTASAASGQTPATR